MPARKRLTVVLCATLTADGKLDTETPAVPPGLYGGTTEAVKHAWGALYDQSAGMLMDTEARRKLKPPDEGLKKPLVAVNWEQAGTWPPEKRRAQLLDALRELGGEFSKKVLCFGGAELFRGLLEARLVDELYLCVRPRIDGRRGGATLSGVAGAFFPASVGCRLVKMEVAGDECFLRYRIVKRAKAERKAA